jgi:hypothetical protein
MTGICPNMCYNSETIDMQSTFFQDPTKPRLQRCEEELPRLQIRITRYAGRHWAVYLNGDLLAVTVYKKGAIAVGNALARCEEFDFRICNERLLTKDAAEDAIPSSFCRQY